MMRRLATDTRGTTIIEFAVIAPVMLLLIMGLCDLAYRSYVQSMLTGAMQKAGRDSTIEDATSKTAQIDAAVMGWVQTVAPSARGTPTRESFSRFSDIKPEQYDDNNANGVWDRNDECFTDVNGSNSWEANPGRTGQGGASDVVVYKMDVKYPRLFPLFAMLGLSPEQQISAKTILKNQPWAAQSVYTSTRICPPPKT